MAGQAITLEGLAEAQQSLRKAGGTPDDQKRLNRDAVERIILPDAQRRAPRRTGAMAAGLSAESTSVYGIVVGGEEYTGVIHFGWSLRGIGSKVAGSAKQKRSALSGALERSGRTSTRVLTSRATSKAVRSSSKKVRGGPIRPNPWIYETIDGRADDVFRFFEAQLDHRAEIEGLL